MRTFICSVVVLFLLNQSFLTIAYPRFSFEITAKDYLGSEDRTKITRSVLATANMLLEKHMHKLSEMNEQEVKERKSELISDAIKAYDKMAKDHGDKVIENRIPPKPNQ